MTTETETMSMKLLIDKRERRILFAEAGKDVVDFLFSLLALPLGSITNLLTKQNMPGSIGSVYESIQNMDADYFHFPPDAKKIKMDLLDPTVPVYYMKSTYLFAAERVGLPGKYYLCSNRGCFDPTYFTDAYDTRCVACDCRMDIDLEFMYYNCNEGIVKNTMMCAVTDDLTIIPMSGAISTMYILNKLNVEDFAMLEERTVSFGLDEVVDLVKASLQSKTVLTDVFLGLKA